MKVLKNIRKNNDTSQILFYWDWHNKSKLHCNGFSSFFRATTFEFSFFQHSISILLAFFSAKSANPTVFRMRIPLAFFSAKSANSTAFRIPILLVIEIFLCEAYRFQKTSQTSNAQKNMPLKSTRWMKIISNKGAVIFKAGYRGGRIFRGVANFLASFYWGIKYFGKDCEISDGL